MPKDDKEQQKVEYELLLNIFMQYFTLEKTPEEILEELAEKRCDIILVHAANGFELTLDEMLENYRRPDTDFVEESDNALHASIVAAIDNLISFAVAAEYSFMQQVRQLEEEFEDDEDEGDEDEDDDTDEDEDEEDRAKALIALCKRYNLQYAVVENLDVEYATSMALMLSKLSSRTMLTYMTMGDERVRPWHLQYEGFTAMKKDFPGWLIPPIEYQCRCYLVEDTVASGSVMDVQAASTIPQKPEWLSPVYSESVSQGGRIFSNAHPYFTILKKDSERLVGIRRGLKQKYNLI